MECQCAYSDCIKCVYIILGESKKKIKIKNEKVEDKRYIKDILITFNLVENISKKL